ncbi:MAG: hypothetical protein K6F92_06320 [Lachnospiraceae bacterium]|nr:hypothetical protein [Lachnospiraceae bacterium]
MQRTVNIYRDGSYEIFLRRTRVRINRNLNITLWACSLAGPAIALGLFLEFFSDVLYMDCLRFTLLVWLMAAVHTVIYHYHPDSMVTSWLSMVAFDVLIVFVAHHKIAVAMMYFFVPLLSMLFCKKGL